MKWFKHYVNAHNGTSLQTLMDELGHDGQNAYWILVSLCAEKLDTNGGKKVSKDDCVFNFHLNTLKKNLQLSPRKMEKFFELSEKLNLFSIKISEKNYQINIPMLFEILDRDAKKTQIECDESAEEMRLRDKNKEEELEENKKKKKEVLKGAIGIFQYSKLLSDLLESVPQETQNKWVELYGKDFLELEFTKAINWLASNPNRPKKDYPRFLGGWLSRAKDDTRKFSNKGNFAAPNSKPTVGKWNAKLQELKSKEAV